MCVEGSAGKDATEMDGPKIDKDHDEILRVNSGCARAESNKEAGWDVFFDTQADTWGNTGSKEELKILEKMVELNGIEPSAS